MQCCSWRACILIIKAYTVVEMNLRGSLLFEETQSKWYHEIWLYLPDMNKKTFFLLNTGRSANFFMKIQLI